VLAISDVGFLCIDNAKLCIVDGGWHCRGDRLHLSLSYECIYSLFNFSYRLFPYTLPIFHTVVFLYIFHK